MTNMVGIHGHGHISFMLMQKAKYSVMNREYQLLFSFLFAKVPMVKTNWENCSRASRFRSVQVHIYHVVIHSSPLYASLCNIL